MSRNVTFGSITINYCEGKLKDFPSDCVVYQYEGQIVAIIAMLCVSKIHFVVKGFSSFNQFNNKEQLIIQILACSDKSFQTNHDREITQLFQKNFFSAVKQSCQDSSRERFVKLISFNPRFMQYLDDESKTFIESIQSNHKNLSLFLRQAPVEFVLNGLKKIVTFLPVIVGFFERGMQNLFVAALSIITNMLLALLALLVLPVTSEKKEEKEKNVIHMQKKKSTLESEIESGQSAKGLRARSVQGKVVDAAIVVREVPARRQQEREKTEQQDALKKIAKEVQSLFDKVKKDIRILEGWLPTTSTEFAARERIINRLKTDSDELAQLSPSHNVLESAQIVLAKISASFSQITEQGREAMERDETTLKITVEQTEIIEETKTEESEIISFGQMNEKVSTDFDEESMEAVSSSNATEQTVQTVCRKKLLWNIFYPEGLQKYLENQRLQNQHLQNECLVQRHFDGHPVKR